MFSRAKKDENRLGLSGMTGRGRTTTTTANMTGRATTNNRNTQPDL